MRTEDLRAFLHVASTGSLTAAATALGVPKSTISRRLSRLEEELRAQLLLRTARTVQLTEMGQMLQRRGSAALASLDELERAVTDGSGVPKGPLRLSAPNDLAAAHLGGLLGRFIERYPEVDVALEASNVFVDLVAEGIDLALRIHASPLASVSGLRTRKLTHLSRGLYAAPDYLKRQGRPRSPEALGQHACLTITASPRRWSMRRDRDEGAREVLISPRLVSSDHHTLMQAAEAGAGIAQLPTFLGEVGVRRERLVRVLPAWTMEASTLSALWPVTHHASPRVRAFVDAAVEYFEQPNWASGATSCEIGGQPTASAGDVKG